MQACTSHVSEESHRLDSSIISHLVNPDDQRPWAERELARELSVTAAELVDPLERLRNDGLIHRYGDLVSATHALVRLYDIEQAVDPDTELDRRLEEVILAFLLTHSDSSTLLTEDDVVKELGHDRKLEVKEALDSLDGIGLIDRSERGLNPSRPTTRYRALTS